MTGFQFFLCSVKKTLMTEATCHCSHLDLPVLFKHPSHLVCFTAHHFRHLNEFIQQLQIIYTRTLNHINKLKLCPISMTGPNVLVYLNKCILQLLFKEQLTQVILISNYVAARESDKHWALRWFPPSSRSHFQLCSQGSIRMHTVTSFCYFITN